MQGTPTSPPAHAAGASLALIALGALATQARAQEPPDPYFARQTIYPSYDAFVSALTDTASIDDAALRDARLDELFAELRAAGQVPYAQGRDVAFLYRGPGSSISFPGDHTGWSTSSSSAGATRLGDSDVWMRAAQLVADSRIDYKIVRDGAWLLDPLNPLHVWGGFGPNSELRMPEYAYPMVTVPRPNQPQGSLSGNILISSSYLGYDVQYRVYTPAGASVGDMPVIYFTDGHEYLEHHLGSAVVVLDNLIANRRVPPTLAVFIDPRDPVTGENKRFQQYVGNVDFADFVALELTSAIDAAYTTDGVPAGRTIVGTSLGGLFSAFLGARHSGRFEHLVIQSPAFQVWPAIYNIYATNASLPPALDIYMEAGTVHDGSGGATMQGILAAGGYDYVFEEVHEGHSWGHWRGKLDDAFVTLLGPP